MRDFMEWEPRSVLCSVSFGSNKENASSSGTSSSNTGIQPADKTSLSNFLVPTNTDAFSKYLQTNLDNPIKLPPLQANGMYGTQQNAVDQLLSQSTGTASSNLAQRGFLNKNATPLAAQQGVQSFLPAYLSQVGTNIQNQALTPQNAYQQNFTDVANAFQQLIALLGGQSSAANTGSQSASATNFGLG